jgi:hypothetical protein
MFGTKKIEAAIAHFADQNAFRHADMLLTLRAIERNTAELVRLTLPNGDICVTKVGSVKRRAK